MNKIIYALFLGTISIAACKKDKQSSVVGKWTLSEADTLCTSLAGATIFDNTRPYHPSDGYAQFNANGTGYSSIPTYIIYSVDATPQNGFDEAPGNFTYTVSGHNIVIYYTQFGLPFQATVSFDSDEMVFTKKIDASKSSYPAKYILTLRYKKSN